MFAVPARPMGQYAGSCPIKPRSLWRAKYSIEIQLSPVNLAEVTPIAQTCLSFRLTLQRVVEGSELTGPGLDFQSKVNTPKGPLKSLAVLSRLGSSSPICSSCLHHALPARLLLLPRSPLRGVAVPQLGSVGVRSSL